MRFKVLGAITTITGVIKLPARPQLDYSVIKPDLCTLFVLTLFAVLQQFKFMLYFFSVTFGTC